MDNVNEKYLKGFNHAYLLAKNNPELLQEILKTNSLNDYIQGLKDGKYFFEQNQTKLRTQELKKLYSQKERSQDKDLER
ncbi:hypothetical protein KCTC32516_00588 [Polaribacter huanghezhanensis]|uniref:hypothetical protein n=1 Tax=Polaribacter huanghezhanensis TaxID=1354726 RepID=UPI002649886C|nr:hypothetical protein [Polaribacter huanghezhanensis]WKD85248.1 hypothetical protein KCTC32516_00588 [Polaribacter huanghezhanensis]